jgi:hypothetical protein
MRYGGSRLPPPVLISFTDATTGARKFSMGSNHSRRQRIVNFTGSLDSPLKQDRFELVGPSWGLSGVRGVTGRVYERCRRATPTSYASSVAVRGARKSIRVGYESAGPP